jgi:hypothetical protein
MPSNGMSPGVDVSLRGGAVSPATGDTNAAAPAGEEGQLQGSGELRDRGMVFVGHRLLHSRMNAEEKTPSPLEQV